MTTDALIKSVSIEAMLQARDAIEERLAFTYPLATEIDGIAQHVPGIGGFKTIAEKRGGLPSFPFAPVPRRIDQTVPLSRFTRWG